MNNTRTKRNNSNGNSFGGKKKTNGSVPHWKRDKPTSNKTTSKRPKQGGGKNKQGPSKLDPRLLVQAAKSVEKQEFRSDRLFDEMKLHPKLKANIKAKGYERPSEIQEATLDFCTEGHDVLGIAQTGTGKTGAFLIPIIDQLLHNKRPFHALIVVPTRELATQVEDEFKSLTKGLDLFSACFIGGTNINRDLYELRRASQIVIGTPGRLLDLSTRKSLDFRKFNVLVLDEYDRMLDMGFVNDIKRMIHLMANRKQTMLFSATLDVNQQDLINQILTKPKTVKVSSGEASSDNIEQDIIRMSNPKEKFKRLCEMLNHEDFEKVLIFDEAKYKVNKLSEALNKEGFKTEAIHGNKTQAARQKALDAFKAGKVKVLVATDVAARGIDVMDITHVINFQIPMTYDSYIHRIVRTGRAGKVGKAFTFVD